jgi:hypothetical protein
MLVARLARVNVLLVEGTAKIRKHENAAFFPRR